MPAMTSVLGEATALTHFMDNVAEPAAAMPDELAKTLLRGVRRGGKLKEQRMTAVTAYELRVTIALANSRIVMTREKAFQVVSHVDGRPTVAKQRLSARAGPHTRRLFSETVISHPVAENAAEQTLR